MLHDFRIALRTWLKSPLFVLVAVGTMAVAIGANTTVFSLINTVLLKDLPYPHGDRLVLVWNTYPKLGLEKATVSIPDYIDRRENVKGFEESALYHLRNLNLAEEGSTPERLRTLRVTPSFFGLFGVKVVRGRAFNEDDVREGADPRIIVSDELWQRRFGGDPSLVGRTIRLNGRAHEVVGITAPGTMAPLRDIALYEPFVFTAADKSDNSRGSEFATMAARLRPGVTPAMAQREAADVLPPILARLPQLKTFVESSGFGPLVCSYYDEVVGGARPVLYLLQGGVFLLLGVACANVANLLLLRAAGRQREMSIRTALGAGRLQLARQLLCEGLLLSVTGGALGLLLAHWGLDFITRIGFGGLPRMRELSVDANVLAFSVTVSVLTGIAFGLAPLLSVRRDVSAESLKDSGTSVTSGRSTGWLRHTLIASEIAAAAILLAGSLLLARSFLKLQDVPVGFQPGNLITASITIPFQRYDSNEKANAFYTRALEEFRAMPGVRSAGYTTNVPFSGGGTTSSYTIVDQPAPSGEAGPHGNVISVDRDYLRTMGIPLVRGRYFDETDALGKPYSAIIDQYMADRYFRGRDPIGRQLRFGDTNGPTYTIVGVVGTIRQEDLAQPVAKETIYFASEQNPSGSVMFAVRTDLAPTSLVPQIRDAIRRIDPELPVFDVRTMDERIENSLTARRAPLTLLMGFGAVALSLAAVGIYGVIAFSVSQRSREIGIRMALGADRRDILALILQQGLKLLAIGVGAGLLVSLAAGRLLSSQLYGVASHDAISLGLAALIVAVATFLGCWLPARRATRVNPITALRTE